MVIGKEISEERMIEWKAITAKNGVPGTSKKDLEILSIESFELYYNLGYLLCEDYHFELMRREFKNETAR